MKSPAARAARCWREDAEGYCAPPDSGEHSRAAELGGTRLNVRVRFVRERAKWRTGTNPLTTYGTMRLCFGVPEDWGTAVSLFPLPIEAENLLLRLGEIPLHLMHRDIEGHGDLLIRLSFSIEQQHDGLVQRGQLPQR